MTEWFSPEVGRLFAFLSLLSLLAGTAPWIEKGQHRKLITTTFFGAFGLGCLFLGLSIVARLVNQPDHVIGALTLAGVVITVVFGVMIFLVRAGYAKAEERKMIARDL